jgi:lipopolysaccharide transport system ATP-binding protein
MSDIAIKVENLSKSYMVGHKAQPRERYTALRDVIVQNAKSLARKTRDMVQGRPIVQGDEVEEFWALKDINFEIKQGDRVGIIGRNGAGKSTLLKILSRITEPTTGRITLNGRVASLLEVGTGFHPELTGRENIFLNGAILGMSRKEIRRKFDEIVEFAEVEKFLDTPVKRYSSGMYVRLAFSVAAHLEPEILIVDEVLAVGDAQFQNKCLGKMEDVATEGRALLFVSHNMAAIRNLCDRCVLLKRGLVLEDSGPGKVIDAYLATDSSASRSEIVWRNESGPSCEDMRLCGARATVPTGVVSSIFDASNPIDIEIDFEVLKRVRGVRFVLTITTRQGETAFATTNHNLLEKSELLQGTYKTRCTIPKDLLNEGLYYIKLNVGQPGIRVMIQCSEILSITVEGANARGSSYSESWPGVVAPRLDWVLINTTGTDKCLSTSGD